ncbi:unnamed protein product [Oikopleura dioica]|uniref:Uncharacterized protein n=1 Tax=Oikopleura dioica TaxID=34765 RepID=E4XPR9_OIKDI|nr:unnamed protein product [Oikopleura dioica]
MLYKKLWLLTAIIQAAPFDQRISSRFIEGNKRLSRSIRPRRSVPSMMLAMTRKTLEFKNSNNNNCVEIPKIAFGSLDSSCLKKSHFNKEEECNVSCDSGDTRMIQCQCRYRGPLFMGCHYEYPKGKCKSSQLKPPTIVPPTQGPATLESPSSKPPLQEPSIEDPSLEKLPKNETSTKHQPSQDQETHITPTQESATIELPTNEPLIQGPSIQDSALDKLPEIESSLHDLPSQEPPTQASVTQKPNVHAESPYQDITKLQEEINQLKDTIQEISAQSLSQHEKQTESIEGFFVMTSDQLYILKNDDLEASIIFIEDQVN